MTRTQDLLSSVSKNFPSHYKAVEELLDFKTVYFETSAFNYLVNELSTEMVLNTRAYLQSVKKKWLISPVTLWEIMVTTDDRLSDRLVFLSQNLFSPHLLATPSEIAVRYLNNAYPDNKVNYSFVSTNQIATIWNNMTKDSSIRFEYNKEQLKEMTNLYQKISKNIRYVLSGKNDKRDITLDTLSHTLEVCYQCMKSDGWKLPNNANIVKLTLLYVLLLIVFRADIDNSEVKEFNREKGFDDTAPLDCLNYICENCPDIFYRGPFVEMANMAYYQYTVRRKDRGIIMDGMHMIYAPYCEWMFSNDQIFGDYAKENPVYLGKLFHMSEVQIKTININKK